MQPGHNDYNLIKNYTLMEILDNVADSFITDHNVINPKDSKHTIHYEIPFPLEKVVKIRDESLDKQKAFVVERLQYRYYGIPLLEVINKSRWAFSGPIDSFYIELAKRVDLIK